MYKKIKKLNIFQIIVFGLQGVLAVLVGIESDAGALEWLVKNCHNTKAVIASTHVSSEMVN